MFVLLVPHVTAFSHGTKTQSRRYVWFGSCSCENAVAWRSDRIDHLFDCEFRCEDCYARWISVDLGKTILVAPELAGFSHSQGHHRPICHLPSMSASPPTAAVTRRLRMSRKVPVPDLSHPDYQKLELSVAGRVDRCLRAQITRVTLDIGKPRAN